MILFADEALIEVHSGKGGNGCIAFRREKYIPRGGPSGGDGGKGGDIVFCVKRNMRTLSKLRHHFIFKAKNGEDGQGWNKYGRDGEDLVIPVPPGTTIRDSETNELIHDFTTESEDNRFVLLKGGNGGWGNVHFKSSTNQAPRYANPGQPSQMRSLKLELSIMADVGLVGFPNAGKSSLLNEFTNARPKIAPYPFTTKIPNLGVLRVDDDRDIIIADIPGIIEGASEGAGLGFDFLRHISRTACLLFMIDCSDENYLTAYNTLSHEIEAYSKDLAAKPRIVLCNKTDVEGAPEHAQEVIAAIHKKNPETVALPVSILGKTGLADARNAIIQLVDKLEGVTDAQALAEKGSAEAEKDSEFLSSRSVDEDADIQYPGSEK